jgi:hypothetical protein
MIEKLMNMIDRLAGAWMNWRVSRNIATSDDPEITKFRVKGIELTEEQGRWDAAIRVEAPGLTMLAGEAAALLGAVNAENFFQFDGMPPPHIAKYPVRITLQWARGMSPAEKCAKLERELKALRGEA